MYASLHEKSYPFWRPKTEQTLKTFEMSTFCHSYFSAIRESGAETSLLALSVERVVGTFETFCFLTVL